MSQVIVPTKKPSSFDEALKTVMTGLSIANQYYGIKANMAQETKSKIEADRAQKEVELERRLQTGGQLSQADKNALSKKYLFKSDPIGVPEVNEFELVDSDGNKVWAINRDQYRGLVEERGKKFDRTQSIRKEFENVTDKNRQAMLAHKKLVTSFDGSPPGDMAGTFLFLKVLDPGSTVREGERAEVENARGVPDSIRNLYNSLLTGQRLTPQQQRQIIAVSARLSGAHQQDFQATQSQFKQLADDMDIDYKSIDRTEFAEKVKQGAKQGNLPAGGATGTSGGQDKNPLGEAGTAVKELSKEIFKDIKEIVTPQTKQQQKPQQQRPPRKRLKAGDL
jgi:hypothetical protein